MMTYIEARKYVRLCSKAVLDGCLSKADAKLFDGLAGKLVKTRRPYCEKDRYLLAEAGKLRIRKDSRINVPRAFLLCLGIIKTGEITPRQSVRSQDVKVGRVL